MPLWSRTEHLEPYVYFPLESRRHIRLLIILPSRRTEDVIDCKITTVSIDEHRPYETLSYTWGPIHADGSHLSQYIRCQGRRLRVTKHLHQFLSRYRNNLSSTQGERKLWVDALCINQHDEDEKASQVAMMAKIYRTASRLNIWLGESKHDKHALMLDGKDDRYIAHSDPHARRCLDWIRSNPYFTRRWIVQELELSPPETSVAWLGCRQYQWLALRNTIGADVKNMEKDFIIYGRPEQQLTLLENLGFCQYAQCSEPKDLIFALLSISSDGHRHTVDYSWTMEKLLLETARTSVASTSQLLNVVLYSLAHPCPQESSLPSWVPDWRRPPLDRHLRGNVTKDLLSQNGAAPGWFERIECTELGRYRVSMQDRVYERHLLLHGWLLQDCKLTTVCDPRYVEDICALCMVKRSVAQIEALHIHIDFTFRDREYLCLLAGSQIAFVVNLCRDDSNGQQVYHLRRVIRIGTQWMKMAHQDKAVLGESVDFLLG